MKRPPNRNAVTAAVVVAALTVAAAALADVRSLRTSPVARLSSRSLAIAVKGSIVCTTGHFAYVHVGIAQERARGDGLSKTFWCDGARQAWRVSVDPREGRFRTGVARARADATTFDEAGVVTGGQLGAERIIRVGRGKP
jgi:hypothetical protein